MLEARYGRVEYITYVQLKTSKIRKYVGAFQKGGREFGFVGNLNSFPCVTAKKQRVADQYGITGPSNIAVVVREIEAWYVAGLRLETLRDLTNDKKLKPPEAVTDVTKEWLKSVIPPEMPRIAFMAKILDKFNLAVARQRSESLRYFLKKYC